MGGGASYIAKIALVGDTVSVSNLIVKYMDGDISRTSSKKSPKKDPIIIQTKKIELAEDLITLQIYGLRGEKQWDVVREATYKGCSSVAVVFSAADKKTYDRVVYWLSEVNKNTNGAYKTLVAAMTDMPAVTGNKVKKEEYRMISKELKLDLIEVPFLVDNKEKQNKAINRLFYTLAEKSLQKLKLNS